MSSGTEGDADAFVAQILYAVDLGGVFDDEAFVIALDVMNPDNLIRQPFGYADGGGGRAEDGEVDVVGSHGVIGEQARVILNRNDLETEGGAEFFVVPRARDALIVGQGLDGDGQLIFFDGLLGTAAGCDQHHRQQQRQKNFYGTAHSESPPMFLDFKRTAFLQPAKNLFDGHGEFNFIGDAFNFFGGDGASGDSDAELERDGEDQIVVELLTDGDGIVRRDGDKKSARIRDDPQAANVSLFDKNIRAAFDELIELLALANELGVRFLILLKADEQCLSAAIDIRPDGAVGIFDSLLELVNDGAARRDADQRARPLTVEGIALGHAEGDHNKNILGEIGELAHKATRDVGLAGEVDVSDVDQQGNIFAPLRAELERVDHIVPIVVGERKTRRIVGGRVEDYEQTILPLEKLVNLSREVGEIEFELVIKQLESLEALAGLDGDDVIIPPKPIGGEDIFAALGVIGDGVMNGAGAAGGGKGADIRVGLMVGEGHVDDGGAVSGQPGNRRISGKFSDIESAINFIDGRESGESAVIVEHDADGRVGDSIGAVYFNGVLTGLICLEDRVVQDSILSVRGSHVQSNHLQSEFNRNQFIKKKTPVNAAGNKYNVQSINRSGKIRCGWR